MSKQLALWAPEMASNGGVQSYMWRLWEMLHEIAKEQQFPTPLGLSLMDTPEAMSNWPCTTATKPECASKSRASFIQYCFQPKYKDAFVLVGHPYQAPAAYLAKKLGHIKGYAVILHGIESWERMSWMRRLALKATSTNIATTRYTAQECARHNDLTEQQFTVIPLCADPNPAKPDKNFKLLGNFPILFVGRLAISERYKGLETLLHSVTTLMSKGYDVTLHVIGDGDDKPYLERTSTNLGLSKQNVVFHGRVTDEILQAAYSQCKIFAMPSKKEGFGIVFLEAMRWGKPCIGGNYGGTPDVIKHGENGFLVEYGNISEIVKTIQILIENDSVLHRMGEKSKEMLEHEFSFAKFLSNYQELVYVL